MDGNLKYRLIRKFKRIMLRDNTNLFQHIFFKYQTYNWWKLYRKVANEREGGKTYVCSYNGTGDVYLATGLLAAKIGPDRVKEATVCVVGGAAKNVASLFGFEDVRALDQAEMNNLMRMCDMLGPENLDIVITHQAAYGTTGIMMDNMRNYNGFNFMDMYKAGVFNDPYLRMAQPKFSDAKESVSKFFEDNGLKPGRNVLLAPYVNTLSMLPQWFWIELVHDLKLLGFTVCTNCGNENERPVVGTLEVCPTYKDLRDFCEYGGYLIASRSGLCDVTSSFNMCKIVVYQPYQFWGEGRNIDYFSLNGMGLSDDAIEMEYEGVEFLKLKDKIIKQVREWEKYHSMESE
ncbi:MAG: hypothetical protein IKH39_01625 [Candidatus Methanomethylophilaceae archaeon]|nr:hypothetical protein [Candidatus Methanomethylophilaceae archaeon]